LPGEGGLGVGAQEDVLDADILSARKAHRIALAHRRGVGPGAEPARADGERSTCDSGSTPGLPEGEWAGWAMFAAEGFAVPP